MGGVTAQNVRIVRDLPSTLGAIDTFCAEVRESVRLAAGRKDLFTLELLLREALINAVKHGNRCDPGKRVRCAIRVEGGRLRFYVGDEGDGFDWREVLGRADNPWAESGRGLRICSLYATRLRFNRKGNRVLAVRELEREGECDA